MPDSHRIHPGTIVGGRRVLAAAAAATAAAEMGIVVTEYNPGMSGEGGSAVSTPERTQSPPVVVSFTRTEKATVGGTALEENVKVRGVVAVEVAVSNAAPLPPTKGGLRNEPVRIGKRPLKKPPKSIKPPKLNVYGMGRSPAGRSRTLV